MEIPSARPKTNCCLCLAKDKLQDVFRIEQGGDACPKKTSVLIDKIYECTNIKLSPSVDAVCAICQRCLRAVEVFYHLRVRSKRVNDFIQENSPDAAVEATTGPNRPEAGVQNGVKTEAPEARPTAANLSPPMRNNPSKGIGHPLHRCRYCPKSFRTLAALTEHDNRAHVSNRRNHCPNCLAQFQHAPSLARHMRNRSCFAFSKYRCRVCSESFPDRQGWAEHIRIHAKDFPFQCPHCWSQFKHKATLRRHTNTVHLLGEC